MKILKISPQDHDVYVYEEEINDGVATVNLKLSDARCFWNCNADEAEKLGNWFVALAKEIRRKDKSE